MLEKSGFNLLIDTSTDLREQLLDAKCKQIDAVLYHDNGVVAQKGSYTKTGKLDGKWLSFNPAGTLTAEAYYNKGQKVGTWTFYNGNTKKEVTYTDSRIGEVTTWTLTDSRVVSN